jgi:glycosyltransferase involved in cell wall biosynthesis
MLNFNNKRVVIISPEAWGKMKISKHHYAIEIAKRGAKVYFLNPINFSNPKASFVEIKESEVTSIQIIDHFPNFPWWLKFQLPSLFYYFLKKHFLKIINKIDDIDIVINFDLNNHFQFHWFGDKVIKIFFPVDEPSEAQKKTGKNAQYLISITSEILEKYKRSPLKDLLINHSIQENFIFNPTPQKSNNNIEVGYAGNLFRPDIDTKTILKLVAKNQHCIFNFWGNISASKNNLGESNLQSLQFIDSLQCLPNVKLHGAVSSNELMETYKKMDVFINCYDIIKDQSKGTNYHKIMEYISTGKVIVSNNISAYKDFDKHFIAMCASRINNDQFLDLFAQVITNLEIYNSIDLQQQRIKFAQSNTYSKNLDKIASFINA